MKNTKNKILESSRRLFNEKGYSNVTIRMIAMDLKLSSGNLNYHFKKREDILEALYFQMVKKFDERIDKLSETDLTLSIVKLDLNSSMVQMIKYSFFWTDLCNLLKVSDNIKSHFQQAQKRRKKGISFLLLELQNKKLLKHPEYDSEQEMLISRLINYSDTWIYSSQINHSDLSKIDIETGVKNWVSNLFPYLTEQGKKEFFKLNLN